jgi:hypothetical protein
VQELVEAKRSPFGFDPKGYRHHTLTSSQYTSRATEPIMEIEKVCLRGWQVKILSTLRPVPVNTFTLLGFTLASIAQVRIFSGSWVEERAT